jgi:fructose-1,6-bisphosphatase II
MAKKSKGRSAERVTKEEAVEIENSLLLEAVRITEQAAIAASQAIVTDELIIYGSSVVREASIDAMRAVLDELNLDGKVVIGESGNHKNVMLGVGQKVGKAVSGAWKVDVAVDAVDGPDFTNSRVNNLVVAVALSEAGGLFKTPDVVMEKLIVGPASAGRVDLRWPADANLRVIAESLNQKVEDLTVAILDGDSHVDIVREVIKAGASVMYLDGDISRALMAAVRGTNVHAVMGSGSAGRGIIAAAALKCLGGEIQARFCPRSYEDMNKLKAIGANSDTIYTTNDLALGTGIVFAMTGITDGVILRGVRLSPDQAKTHTLSMAHQTKVVRFSKGIHSLKRRTRVLVNI